MFRKQGRVQATMSRTTARRKKRPHQAMVTIPMSLILEVMSTMAVSISMRTTRSPLSPLPLLPIPPQGFDGTRGIEGNTAFDENGEFREFSEDEMDDVDEIIEGLLAQPNEPSASCTGVETLTITISQNDILHHEETVGACQDGPEFEIVQSLYMMFGSY